MNVLPKDRKVQIINGLCNGMSLRACSRVFGTHRTAIQRLLVRVGTRCDELLTEQMKDLDILDLEMDELWTFCGKKEGRLRTLEEKMNPGLGDQYLFFAIDRKSKVVPAWAIGKRDEYTALELLYRLRRSLNGCRPQISTDAWAGYRKTIGSLFGDSVDWATLTKKYERVHPGRGRYAPPRVSSTKKGGGAWLPRSGPHLHQHRGTLQPHRSDNAAPIHPVDRSLQPEDRKPESCLRTALRLLQLRLAASDPRRPVSSYGSRRYEIGCGRSRIS